GQTHAPPWVCETPVEGLALSAVGSASPSAAGTDFQRSEAEASARERLARMLSTRVEADFNRYVGTTGGETAETVDRVSKDVTRQLTETTLQGSKTSRVQRNPSTGKLYVLVGMDAASLKASATGAVRSSINSSPALWQELMARKGRDEM